MRRERTLRVVLVVVGLLFCAAVYPLVLQTAPIPNANNARGSAQTLIGQGWGVDHHPNTSMGIHAGWFAVHDTRAQLRVLRDAGFEVGESREVKFLSAHGREVKAGLGALLLLESRDKDGLLTKYLSDHDEGIIGLSIEVADLGKAHQLAESGTGRKLETYKGFYGTSFLLPPEVTHGVWLEMFQPTDLLH